MDDRFYVRPVLEVARDLIGCLVTRGVCSGVIVETEAYHHDEPASHAFVGLTPRTKTLFDQPGRAYIYRSYGVHAMLNAVCEPRGVGSGVLIRALQPVDGIELMADRRGSAKLTGLCSGPGKLTEAMGITLADNGSDLTHGEIMISERPTGWTDPVIQTDVRIGITRAVELPWRFCVSGSRFLSRPVSRAYRI